MATTPSTLVPSVTLDREHLAIATELHEAFDRVLRRSGFILGEEVARFEEAWAQACGVSECVGVRPAPRRSRSPCAPRAWDRVTR